MPPTERRISDEAIQEATGQAWDAWFEQLDAADAASWEHSEIAAHLADQDDVSAWWAQTIAVQYERERGLREVGQTRETGYQIGVQRSVDVDPATAYELVTSPEGLACWMGQGAPESLEEGTTFELADGTTGEIRVVSPGSHVRLTWHPDGWELPSTLQVRVNENPSGSTAISFHHEGLPDAATRTAMQAWWRRALEALLDDD